MRIGVPKEIKNHEYRVGLSPASVAVLVQQGHDVWAQQHVGTAISFSNDDYRAAGAPHSPACPLRSFVKFIFFLVAHEHQQQL